MALLKIEDSDSDSEGSHGEIQCNIRWDWKKRMKVPELRKTLGSMNLNNKGKRNVLVKRLDSHILQNELRLTYPKPIIPEQSEWLEGDAGGSSGSYYDMQTAITVLAEAMTNINKRFDDFFDIFLNNSLNEGKCSEPKTSSDTDESFSKPLLRISSALYDLENTTFHKIRVHPC